MKSKIIIIFLLKFIFSSNSYCQALEFDLGFGLHLSNINFHHSSEVNTDDDSEFQAFDSSNFRIGFTAPLSNNNWFIRSEMGFLKTNSFFSINYKYNELLGEQNAIRITYLSNQKLFLSITPEYRVKLNSTAIKLSGGLIFSSDISNTMSTNNTVLLPKSNPMGMKLETGVQYMWNKIGLQFNISYIKLGSSELQNRWHPKISYDLILFNYGVIYSI